MNSDDIEPRGRADDCPLTDREMYAARVVGEHYAAKLRTVIYCMAAVAVIALSGNVVGWVLTRGESEQRATQLANEASVRAADLAQEAAARADDIQSSRLELLVDTCISTNARNRRTLAALDRLAPKRPTPAERRSLVGAKLIVTAIVPLTQDCEATARKRLMKSVRPSPP